MDNLTHIVLDLETLGLGQDAVILSLGAVAFKYDYQEPDFKGLMSRGFHCKFSVQEQIKRYSRTMTDSTLDWWKVQSEEAKALLRPSPDDMTLAGGLEAFNTWLKQSGYSFKESFVWSRGTYFDFPKLEHAYDQAGVPVGYNGWKIRDVRTFIDVLLGTNTGKFDVKVDGFLAHNAMADAAMDAVRMQTLFNEAAV